LKIYRTKLKTLVSKTKSKKKDKKLHSLEKKQRVRVRTIRDKLRQNRSEIRKLLKKENQ